MALQRDDDKNWKKRKACIQWLHMVCTCWSRKCGHIVPVFFSLKSRELLDFLPVIYQLKDSNRLMPIFTNAIRRRVCLLIHSDGINMTSWYTQFIIIINDSSYWLLIRVDENEPKWHMKSDRRPRFIVQTFGAVELEEADLTFAQYLVLHLIGNKAGRRRVALQIIPDTTFVCNLSATWNISVDRFNNRLACSSDQQRICFQFRLHSRVVKGN